MKIFNQLVLGLAAFAAMASSTAQAQSLAFQNLTDAQAKSIIEEFGANFMHTSVTGASSLGTIFGFQLGVVAGQTATPEIDQLVKSTDPASSSPNLYHGAILAMVSVPMGFTIEASYLPSLGGDDFKFDNMGFAAKWTMTDTLLALPLDLALKAHYMKTGISFTQTSPSSEVNVDTTTSGLQLIAGKSFAIVEPYVGIGMASVDGSFGVTGTSIFQSMATSYSAKASGMQWMLGADVNLLLVRLGVEMSNFLGNQRYSARVAFGF